VYPISIEQQPSGANVQPMLNECMQEGPIPRRVSDAHIYNTITTKVKAKGIVLKDTLSLWLNVRGKEAMPMTTC